MRSLFYWSFVVCKNVNWLLKLCFLFDNYSIWDFLNQFFVLIFLKKIIKFAEIYLRHSNLFLQLSQIGRHRTKKRSQMKRFSFYRLFTWANDQLKLMSSKWRCPFIHISHCLGWILKRQSSAIDSFKIWLETKTKHEENISFIFLSFHGKSTFSKD